MDDAKTRAPSILWAVVLVGITTSLLALAVTAQTYLSMRGHGHSFPRMFLWQLSCWGLWALAAPWILRSGALLFPSLTPGRQRWPRLILVGLTLIAAHTVVASELTVWFQPLLPVQAYSFRQALATQFASVFAVDLLIYALLLVGGGMLAVQLRKSRLEAELARAQFHALSLEIQPHFLFNTLNSIAALIRSGDDARALDMLLSLSELMRSTVDRPSQQLARLGSEIDFVRRYVDLQRYRFGDRLEVAFDVSDGCHDVEVPTFLLQPLVENAIRHGMGKTRRLCRLEVGASPAQGRRMRVWVRDNGIGLPAGFQLERDAGVGLRNARSRLQQVYGSGASFTIRSTPDSGTTVELLVPLLSPQGSA